MNRTLALLAELTREDTAWLLSKGTELQVIAEQVVVHEGRDPEALFFVLEGLVNVRHAALGTLPLARLGPGELFGDMSLLEGLAPTATVVAAENSLLLVLPRSVLDTRLATDEGFAARLYKAFAVLNARRLRETTGSLGDLLRTAGTSRETATGVVALLADVLAPFKGLLAAVDEEALHSRGRVTAERGAEVRRAFGELVTRLNDVAGEESPHPPAVREAVGRYARREVLPYLLMTRTAERMYAKPRGYAGDFLTIEWIYENRAQGTGRLGPLLDRCFLDEPAARAVQNRRGLLVEEIRRSMEEHGDSPTRVTSLACGPAREVFDAFEALSDPSRLKATLVDIDLQALAFVGDRVEERGLQRHVTPVNANLVYLATGRHRLDVPPQDLVYSVGLIDYFADGYVVTLLNYVYELLRPGGRVILGNFHPRNTSRAMMDWVLDWHLIHRTEDDMNRLFLASAFGRPCGHIRFEEEGVNLFAACEKALG